MDFFSILLEPTFWIGVFLVAFYALYRYGTQNFNLFSENGIPGPKPLPFVGNMWGVWEKTMWKEDMKHTKIYGKVFGIFEGKKPTLIVSDPEIVKQIMVKDFDHFNNHSSFGGPKIPIFSKMVFVLEDQEWKDVRSSITPAFSSGKIKKMTGTINEHINKRLLRLKEEARTGCKIDSMRLFSEITVGVIAECAFGIKFDDLSGKDSEFLQQATMLLGSPEDEAMLTSYYMLLPFLFPSMVAQYIGNNEAYEFFMEAIKRVVQARAESTEEFNDFLSLFQQLLSNVTVEEKGEKRKRWTGADLEEIIAAQALEFMIDGYAGTAMSMSSLVYRLTMHPDIQDKLYADVMEKLDTFGGVSHEMILEMTYLDQFISEAARIQPIVPRIDRQCCKDITYGNFTIKKGMNVQIPVYTLHHSEEYFPNPEVFDPDRFSPENKANIIPYTYLPFGGGPRGCIGSRFAIEQIKLVMCSIISQFEFYPIEETMSEFEFKPGYTLLLAPKNNLVGVRVRQN